MSKPNCLFLRHEKPPVTLAPGEFIGPPIQDTWIDPLSNSGVIHKGRSVEELEREGYVGVYIPLKLLELVSEAQMDKRKG